MELTSFLGKKVCIIDVDRRVFYGRVDDYFFPEDNEHGKESIVITVRGGDAIEFTEEDIENIYVL